jgi:hypothetical protein
MFSSGRAAKVEKPVAAHAEASEFDLLPELIAAPERLG